MDITFSNTFVCIFFVFLPFFHRQLLYLALIVFYSIDIHRTMAVRNELLYFKKKCKPQTKRVLSDVRWGGKTNKKGMDSLSKAGMVLRHSAKICQVRNFIGLNAPRQPALHKPAARELSFML